MTGVIAASDLFPFVLHRYMIDSSIKSGYIYSLLIINSFLEYHAGVQSDEYNM